MELVAPGRISNAKYDKQLLSKVTLNALTVQGIPEAYDWLKLAVEQSDIPIGAAVQSSTPPGALGPLYECGAGQRVAHVQLILPSEDRDDPEKFWAIPASAMAPPIVHNPAAPLPAVRYTALAQVPAHMRLHDVSDSDDSDNQPLVALTTLKRKRPALNKHRQKRVVKKAAVKKRAAKKRSMAAGGPKAAKERPLAAGHKAPKKKRRTMQTDEQDESLSNLPAGTYVLTHDMYDPAVEGQDERPGFAVCRLVGNNLGTAADGCWRYKHLLSLEHPWKKSIVHAKFGIGKGCIVNSGTAVVQAWSIVGAWKDGLTSSGELPVEIQGFLKQHRHWSVLED
jgi:hypothetical protein